MRSYYSAEFWVREIRGLHRPRQKGHALFCVSAVLGVVIAATGHAAVISTTGSSTDLGNTLTWSGGVTPGAGDTANFINSGTYTASNGSTFTFGGMTFNDAAAVEISPAAGNAITINLGTGGLGGTTNVNRLGNTNNLVTLALGANDQTWSIASPNTGANITGTATVELTATGQTQLRGNNSGFTGTWKVSAGGTVYAEGLTANQLGGQGSTVELLNDGKLRLGGTGVARTFSAQNSIKLTGNGGILAQQPGVGIDSTVTTSQPILGTGDLTLEGLFPRNDSKTILNLGGNITHTGDTIVKGAINASHPFTVNLTSPSSMTFTIGANGVNNSILDQSGGGFNALTLGGTFVFDRSGASIADGNAWTIVGSGFDSLAYGQNFSVSGFTEETPGQWTLVDAATTWSFSESTGNLTIAVVPEPSGLLLAASSCGLLVWWRHRRRCG